MCHKHSVRLINAFASIWPIPWIDINSELLPLKPLINTYMRYNVVGSGFAYRHSAAIFSNLFLQRLKRATKKYLLNTKQQELKFTHFGKPGSQKRDCERLASKNAMFIWESNNELWFILKWNKKHTYTHFSLIFMHKGSFFLYNHIDGKCWLFLKNLIGKQKYHDSSHS